MHNRAFPALLVLAAAALGGCETTGTGTTPEVAAAPPTRQQAALDCWMGTEKSSRTLSLDQRADLVNKCIDEKMKGQPTPMLTEAKPAKPKPGSANAAAEAKPAAANAAAAPTSYRAGEQPPKP